MHCYFCEHPLSGQWYHLANGRAVCDDCLCHIGLEGLLDALEIPTLGELLLRFCMAEYHFDPPYSLSKRRLHI